MRFDVVTLFPELFEVPLRTSMLGRAAERGVLEFVVHDLRSTASAGIGPSTISRTAAEPGWSCAPSRSSPRSRRCGRPAPSSMLLDPAGERLTDALARELAGVPRLALVCGRYEGIDERVRSVVDREVSIGDYVLTGGELPALVVIDAVSRLVPGVIEEASQLGDSFATGLLEFPQYTRPESFAGLDVPAILRSGHHAAVERWRRREALRRTLRRRPDLLDTAPLSADDRVALDELRADPEAE